MPENRKVVFDVGNVLLRWDPFHLYRNLIPDDATRDWNYNFYNPFESNNSLLSTMTGNTLPAYEFQTVEAEGDGSVVGTYAFSAPAGGCEFSAPINEAGHVYAYVDCRAASGIDIVADRTNEDGEGEYRYWSVTPYEPYIIDAGHMNAGDTLRVTINGDSTCGGNIYVVRLNEEVYKAQMAALAKNQIDVTTFTDTRVEGTISASRGTVSSASPRASFFAISTVSVSPTVLVKKQLPLLMWTVQR